MTDLIAVDPGVEYYAVARFSSGALRQVLVPPVSVSMSAPFWADVLVIEKPQVYNSGRARRSDIVDLAISAGRVARMFATPTEVWYTPAQWKGQIAKKPHHARIRARLDEKELALLDKRPQKELVHILDAVGLGLFHLGRI